MQQLWLFYDENYQQITIPEKGFTALTIGPAIEHDITIQTFPFINGPLTLKKRRKDSPFIAKIIPLES